MAKDTHIIKYPLYWNNTKLNSIRLDSGEFYLHTLLILLLGPTTNANFSLTKMFNLVPKVVSILKSNLSLTQRIYIKLKIIIRPFEQYPAFITAAVG